MSKSAVGRIRVDGSERGLVLVGDLPPSSFAYFDRDWLPAPGQLVPSLLVLADGSLSWCGGPPIKAPRRVDPDAAAALVLLAIAEEAAAPVEGLAPASVEVSGTGLIARRVRALLRNGATAASTSLSASEVPRAIVELTGDAAAILDATRRVADSGLVVLAGETLDSVPMNLYPDVHVRGLTLVGISAPLEAADALFGRTRVDDRVIDWSRASLVRVRTGDSLPLGAPWFVLSSS
jgi:hypothetical protein